MKRTYITADKESEHRNRTGFIDISRYAMLVPEDCEIGSISEIVNGERVCVERIFLADSHGGMCK